MESAKNLIWESRFRDAIRQSGLSLNKIGDLSGVDAGQLSRFMRNERGLTLVSAEKVGRIVGIRLTGKRGEK